MKIQLPVLLAAFLVSGMASANEKQLWLTSKLYGNDNDIASLRAVTIRQEKDKYVVFIKNQFKFECEITFDQSGKPSELLNCVSQLKDDPMWTASPDRIKLKCFSTKKERICRGKYTLSSGKHYSSEAEMTIARKL
ncbi:hypothetical protein [Spartinivicinus ruber]|uniref:hypothetical protein n=1 Tax=Spartinivicinus ruber TaxID=2683272 RepID=UPI0013CFD6EE|nr:hypothetical protein [Spartinivicinus ruber]